MLLTMTLNFNLEGGKGSRLPARCRVQAHGFSDCGGLGLGVGTPRAEPLSREEPLASANQCMQSDQELDLNPLWYSCVRPKYG